jgi:SnoaL-like domain
MITQKQINEWIEAYAKAVKDRKPKAVSELFAEHFDHIVHGAGIDPNNPWNTKRETDREGIRKIYEDFFSNVKEIAVEYTDRIIDVKSNSAAMVVRVKNEDICMENALHIKWNDQGEIVFFYNWYGQSID